MAKSDYLDQINRDLFRAGLEIFVDLMPPWFYDSHARLGVNKIQRNPTAFFVFSYFRVFVIFAVCYRVVRKKRLRLSPPVVDEKTRKHESTKTRKKIGRLIISLFRIR